MKTVFSNSTDVIHTFAQRHQSIGRSSNVYFNDRNKIYSYGSHYLLGEFLDDNTILINDVGYSNTTSKHIGEIRQATRQYKQFFTMSTDLKLVLRQCEELDKKIQTAKSKKDSYIAEIINLYKSVLEYQEYKGEIKDIMLFHQICLIVEKYQDVKIDFKELLKQEDLKIKNKEKQFIKDFLSYKLNYIHLTEDILRISKDKNFIETSQKVRISIKAGLLLYKMIKAKKDIKGYKIEGYTVISMNKILKIGCHNISLKYVKKLGEQLLKQEIC